MKVWTLLTAALLSTPALADEGNTRRFDPSPLGSPYLSLDTSLGLGKGQLGAGAVTVFEQRPLVFYRDGERTADLVAQRALIDLHIAYGILDWLDVGALLPFIPYQQGDGPRGDGTLGAYAVGDPQLALRARLLSPRKGLGLALITAATTGAGGDSALVGDSGSTVDGRLALEVPLHHRLDLVLNGGYRLRPTSTVHDLRVDDELMAGLGLSARPHPSVAVIAELRGAALAKAPLDKVEETPLDGDLGIRVHLGGEFHLVFGGGGGLLPGYGSPAWRGFLGVQRIPRRHDFDADTVVDRLDKCVDVFGIPAEAGCPAKVVVEAPPPEPKPDDPDQDGIATEDLCPLLPEDVDGFRDDDGCPDPDHDLDLIADKLDADPMSPEDWDGFEDEDGRSDLDNDLDGIADYLDGCPEKAGGADGCPGSLAAHAPFPSGAPALPSPTGPYAPLVLGDTLHPSEPLQFEDGGPTLLPESQPVLAGLAGYLASLPEGVFEVAVHVAGGDESGKRRLSEARARAVVKGLIGGGLDAQRVKGRGFGAEVPVASNQTAEGRAKNRRVEVRVSQQSASKAPSESPTRPGKPTPRWHGKDAVVFSEPIDFVPLEATLTEGGQASVEALAQRLEAHPEYRRVEVGVHTDGVGNTAWRMGLSVRRAQVIRDELIKRGISGDRLVPKGYGATRRLARDTSSGTRRNRRVELLVLERAQDERLMSASPQPATGEEVKP